MTNRPDTPQKPPVDPGKEALARAKAARAVLREQQEMKEQRQKEGIILRRAFYRNTARRTCLIYATLNIIYFFVYLAVIYPIKQQPFADMIRGGTSVIGHAVFFAAAFLSALVYSLILYKRQPKKAGAVMRFLSSVSIWFSAVMGICIAAHGIYLDMLYNQYAVTQSGIFLGPSFLLTFAALVFSVCLTAVNRIYRMERFPTAIRVMLHLVCVLILIPLCFQVIAHGFAAASDLLIFLVIFILLYLFVCILYYAAKGSIRREENNEEAYESMFKKAPPVSAPTDNPDQSK